MKSTQIKITAVLLLFGSSTLVHSAHAEDGKPTAQAASPAQPKSEEPSDEARSRLPASTKDLSDETVQYLRQAGARVEKIFDRHQGKASAE